MGGCGLETEILNRIKQYCTGIDNDLVQLDQFLQQVVNGEIECNKTNIAEGILNILDQFPRHPYYFFTFLIYLTMDKLDFKRVLHYCIEDEQLTLGNKFFLYYQFVTYGFLIPEINDDEVSDLLYQLYIQIYEGYKKQIVDLEFISKVERNKDLVMVFISQILGMSHGPTKTLLDRCYILQKHMNKKVFVVNTAEFRPDINCVPVFCGHDANYREDLNDCTNLEYRGIDISFFQCPKCMPNLEITEQILDVVRTEKPYYILSIGGGSIVSDLCSNIVPTITIGTVFSGRPTTAGTFLAVGRKKTESDKQWIKKYHKSDDCIIESLFTFSFREQEHVYTRRQLGLPQNKFVVLIVGGRLDEEIDDKLRDVLYKLMDAGLYVAFLGTYQKYEEEFVKEIQEYRDNSIYLGFQDDVLAIDECCDLYINPMRLGGGGSAAEAMYKGLPVVTFNHGDVGVVAGEEFHVNSYGEMYEKVLKYSTDKDYYQKMSELAKQRADELLDSKEQFKLIIKKAMESPRF